MNGSPTALPDDLRDRLAAARAVLADVAHHSDHVIRVAARTVFIYAPDEADSREGLALLQLMVRRSRPKISVTVVDGG